MKFFKSIFLFFFIWTCQESPAVEAQNFASLQDELAQYKNKIFLSEKIPRSLLLGIFIISLFLPSCQNNIFNSNHFQKQWFLMDTLIEVTISLDDSKKAEEYMGKVYNELKRIENLFTGYDSTGEIWKINNSNGKRIQINPEVFNLINTSIVFSELSDGAFDITVWPLIQLWGFGQKKHEQVPDSKDIETLLRLVNYKLIGLFPDDKSIQLSQNNVGLDLGGIAKGYALDRVAGLLKKAGIVNFLINAGGDIIVSGTRSNGKKWRVGIQHPRTKGVIETLELSDCAIVTSGDYERFFIKDGERYHHILDPSTGYPSDKCISCTVIVDSNLIQNSGTIADVLSTAIFVLGHKKGIKLAETFKGTKIIFITPEQKMIKNFK